jgi:hypothetical protein
MPLRVGQLCPPARISSTASRWGAGQPCRQAAPAAVGGPILPPIARIQFPRSRRAVRALADRDLMGSQQPAPRRRSAPSRPPPPGASISSTSWRRAIDPQGVCRRGGDRPCPVGESSPRPALGQQILRAPRPAATPDDSHHAPPPVQLAGCRLRRLVRERLTDLCAGLPAGRRGLYSLCDGWLPGAGEVAAGVCPR